VLNSNDALLDAPFIVFCRVEYVLIFTINKFKLIRLFFSKSETKDVILLLKYLVYFLYIHILYTVFCILFHLIKIKAVAVNWFVTEEDTVQ
jgi:hypothetical protein